MPIMMLMHSAFIGVVTASTTLDGLVYLDDHAKQDSVIVTPSGLQYKVLESGPDGGKTPEATSECTVHYHGKLISGETFDSSYASNRPAKFKPNGVVKGWKEALQMMKEGDRWELVLPSELGYGDRGSGSKIPGGAVLIFELELLKVRHRGERSSKTHAPTEYDPNVFYLSTSPGRNPKGTDKQWLFDTDLLSINGDHTIRVYEGDSLTKLSEEYAVEYELDARHQAMVLEGLQKDAAKAKKHPARVQSGPDEGVVGAYLRLSKIVMELLPWIAVGTAAMIVLVCYYACGAAAPPHPTNSDRSKKTD